MSHDRTPRTDQLRFMRGMSQQQIRWEPDYDFEMGNPNSRVRSRPAPEPLRSSYERYGHRQPDHIFHVVDGASAMPYTHEATAGHIITGSWCAYAQCNECLIGMRFVLTTEIEERWLYLATLCMEYGPRPSWLSEMANIAGTPHTVSQQQQRDEYFERKRAMYGDEMRGTSIQYVERDGVRVPVPPTMDPREVKYYEWKNISPDEMVREQLQRTAINKRDIFKGLYP
jgi:hypothetical protein